MSDTKELTIKLKAEDEASAKIKAASENVSNSYKKVADGIKTMSTAAAVALTGIVAFGVASVKSYAALAEETQNTAQITGLMVHEVAALRLASEQTSVPMASLETAIKKFELSLIKAQEPSSNAAEQLGKLGIKLADIRNKSPADALFIVGDAIAKIRDPAERTKAAIDLFGKSGTDIIPIFEQGVGGMQKWIDKADAMGVSMDEVGVKRALEADQAFDDLNTSLQGLTQTLAREFLPGVTSTINAMIPVIQSIGSWISYNHELFQSITLWTLGILAAIASINPLVSAVKGLSTVLTFLTGTPIGLAITTIAALAAGIKYLYETNETARNVINSAWLAITSFVGESVQTIKDHYQEWLEKALDVGTRIIAWLFDLKNKLVQWVLDHQTQIEQVKQTLIGWWEKTLEIGKKMAEWFITKKNELVQFVKDHQEQIDAIKKTLIGWWEKGVEILANLWKDFSGFLSRLKGWYDEHKKEIIDKIIADWESVKISISKAWDWLVTFFTEWTNKIKGTVNGWMDVFNGFAISTGNVAKTVASIWDAFISFFTKVFEPLKPYWDSFWDWFTTKPQEVSDIVIGIFQDMVAKAIGILTGFDTSSDSMLGTTINRVKQLSNQIGDAVKVAQHRANVFEGITHKVGVSGYATGGRPPVGQMSIVGEQGPEYFIPDTAGTIIPNNQLAGAGGLTINIIGNTLLDRNAATKIGDLIIGQLRLNKRL